MLFPFLSRLIRKLTDVGLTLAPVVLAEGARVALGDEIAERPGARLVLVLIGRLGVYEREGQMSDYEGAALMLPAMPKAKQLLADKGYDADWFRAPRKTQRRRLYPVEIQSEGRHSL